MPNNLERYRSVLNGIHRGEEASNVDIDNIQKVTQRELFFLIKNLIPEWEKVHGIKVRNEISSRSQDILYYLSVGLQEPSITENEYTFVLEKINSTSLFSVLLDNALFPLKHLINDSYFKKFERELSYGTIDSLRTFKIRSYNKHEIIYCLREMLSREMDVKVLNDEMILNITGFDWKKLNWGN